MENNLIATTTASPLVVWQCKPEHKAHVLNLCPWLSTSHEVDIVMGACRWRYHDQTTHEAEAFVNVWLFPESPQTTEPHLWALQAHTDMLAHWAQDWATAAGMGLSAADVQQIKSKGISWAALHSQLKYFRQGIRKIELERAATVHDGILRWTNQDFEQKAAYFDQHKQGLKLKKMVPASGAASRMFHFLSLFLQQYRLGEESLNAYINRTHDTALPTFLAGMEKFPFYPKIIQALEAQLPDYAQMDANGKAYFFVKHMLTHTGLNMSQLPKGVIAFHSYPTHQATPIEEHIKECLQYAHNDQGAHLHFTVTPEHQPLFEQIVHEVMTSRMSDYHIQVQYSFQEPATDTLAVTSDNQPFRNEQGQLLFRPGGHGALLNNLNRLDADVIFIKNIDNVNLNHEAENTLYKKALAGHLLQIRQQVVELLTALDQDRITPQALPVVLELMSKELHIELPEDFKKYTFDWQLQYIRERLNRPIRVCGMVKNEGEPGGGPFWVRHPKGECSLQIVEQSQVDMLDEQQRHIFQQSTHFNPVDLVCCTKDYKGSPFDLQPFTDPDTGFIVHKTHQGQPLKGYEWPGLWNGSMARWITVFVEVPLSTFNPVKTVNDLLKPAHQPLP